MPIKSRKSKSKSQKGGAISRGEYQLRTNTQKIKNLLAKRKKLLALGLVTGAAAGYGAYRFNKLSPKEKEAVKEAPRILFGINPKSKTTGTKSTAVTPKKSFNYKFWQTIPAFSKRFA